MPIDPSIPLQAQGLNLNTIGTFLDLGAKKLALDRGRATYGADVAQRKAESSSSQSRATVDAANVQPLIEQQAAQTDITKTGARRTAYELTRDQGMAALQQVSGLIQDPAIVKGDPKGAMAAVRAAKKRAIDLGVPEEQADVMFGRLIVEAHDTPNTLRQTLANIIQGGQGAGGQAAQNLVPAGMQQQAGAPDVRGNPTVQTRDQFGNLSQTSLPQTAQPMQATQAAPLQYPSGENPGTYKLLNDEREAARTTISQAPTIHALNSEILSELKLATTGQYSGLIAKAQSIGGLMGLSLTGNNELERAASAYDLIDKYTTQAATRAAQSMGNDTATALNAQMKQNASVERNPTAIKKSILFNDAVLSGAESYQQGLEKSIQNNPQADLFVKRKFDQEWAKNFDPIIMQIYNAKKSGDKEELADLVKSLGNRAPEIMRKAQRLQELSQRGL